MNVDIGISSKNLNLAITHLNKILSDEFVLYTKTLNYHWNVVGPHFDSLHLFFRRQYEDLFEIVDIVAERIRTLGGWPYASLAEYGQLTRLKEDKADERKTDMEMLAQLLKDHETLIKHIRQDIKIFQDQCDDEGTANLITDELLEKHEKMAWMLRAFVSGKNGFSE
jgi:starvation-inducible DNA-binding protein